MFTFVRVESEELREAVYRLRYEVFVRECGFVPPPADGGERDVDRYDAASVHFAARDAGGQLAGTLRMVLPSPLGFPIQTSCSLPDPGGVVCAEVSRLAVARRYRRRAVDRGPAGVEGYGGEELLLGGRRRAPVITLGLWRIMFQESLRLGIERWYVVMEESLRRLLASYNIPFEPIGPAFDWGGPVRPCIGDIPTIAAQAMPFFLAGLDRTTVAPQYREVVSAAVGGGSAVSPC